MSKRPHIIVNMAMSADGKISTFRREAFPLGSRRDSELMSELRAQADAVVIGAGTLRIDGHPILVRSERLKKRREERGLPAHPINVVLSGSLDLPTNKGFFHHKETQRIVFTGRPADVDLIRRLERYAEVLVMPGKRVIPEDVIETLSSRGAKNLVLEGGGELNCSFFKARLVDEIYITVAPLILGGKNAPTVVDGRGFLRDEHLKLDLISVRCYDNEVFLRYRVIEG